MMEPTQFGNITVYQRDVKSCLTPATGFIKSYDFTLNPYQGCQYGCSYCYAAAFSPNAKLRQDWGNWVVIKQNAVEVLKKDLERWFRRHPNQPPSIYMSSVTDPYQPLEAKTQLTRCLLEVLVDYRPTLVIQTRSPLVTRDLDLFQRFKFLRINMSIPSGSESVRRDFEPRSPSLQARVKAMQMIKAKIDPSKGYVPKLSITMTPLLPTLPEEQLSFIQKLNFVDRVVIQPFHASSKRSLIAGTRTEAKSIQQKYSWWYDNEAENYEKFKQQLVNILKCVEIKEGQGGFGYE